MSMEVGRIKAVITAETGEFSAKMAHAQRSFEQTANKMNGAALKANATVKRALTDRERWFQENVRLDNLQQRSSVNTSKAVAAAAREQARVQREGMAMARAHDSALKMNAAMLNNAGRAAARAAQNFGRLRGPLTSIASALIPLPANVTRFSSALGGLAISAGPMIAVLAGMAALGFAWEKITRNAKDAQKAQEAAIDAARKIRMGPLGTEIEQKQTVTALRDELRQKLADAERGRTVAMRGGVTKTIIDQGDILQLKKDLAEAEKAVKTFQGVISDANVESQQDAADAAARAAEAAERAAKEFEKWRIIVKDLDAEMGRFLTDLLVVTDRMNKLAARGAAPRPGLSGRTTTGSGMPRTVTGLGVTATTDGKVVTAVQRWASTVNKAAEATEKARKATQSFGDALGEGVGGTLKGMFGKEGRQQIAANLGASLVSGGVTAIVGAAANFATGLLTHAKRAKEALKLHMEAVNDWDRSLRAAIASLRGETEKSRMFAAIDDITQMVRGLEETFKMDFGVIPVFDSMDQLVEWLKKQQALIATLKEKFPFLNFDEFSQRLQVLIDYAKELGISLGETSDAAKAATESMTNVPAGFKVAKARFDATIPEMKFRDAMIAGGVPSMGVPNVPPGTTTGGGSSTVFSVTGPITVTGVEDVPGFIEKLEIEVMRQKARGGSGISLDYL